MFDKYRKNNIILYLWLWQNEKKATIKEKKNLYNHQLSINLTEWIDFAFFLLFLLEIFAKLNLKKKSKKKFFSSCFDVHCLRLNRKLKLQCLI